MTLLTKLTCIVLVAFTGTVGLAGCGDSSSPPAASDARAYAASMLRARSEGVDRAPAAFRRLDELLGNTVFSTDGQAATSLTDAVVRGTVVRVRPGYGFVPASSAPAGSQIVGDGAKVDFDDPHALWRTEHLSVKVDEVFHGDVAVGDVIEVGQVINSPAETDANRFSKGIQEVGEAVWFLRKGSPVFAYDSTLYADVEDGSLIAPVDRTGALTLPFADPEEAARLTRSGPTVGTLRSAARRPRRVIQLQTRAGVVQRVGA